MLGAIVALVLDALVGAEALAQPPAAELTWATVDGQAFLVAVPAADLDAFLARRRAALAIEQARLQAIASSPLAAAGGDVLTRLMLHVPAYIDWVYSWIDSYVAAFKVVARGSSGWLAASRSDGPTDPAPIFGEALRGVAREKLDAIVVRPVDPALRLKAALGAIDATLADEWRRVLARDRERWLGLLAHHTQGARRIEAASVGTVPVCLAPAPDAGSLAMNEATLSTRPAAAEEDLLVWRVTRPLAIRIVSVATRLAIGGASGSSVSMLGLGGAAAGGTIVSAAATTAAVWSADYGLNLVDGVLHRDQMTAQVIEALAGAMAQEQDAVASGLAQRVTAAVATLDACPPNLPTQPDLPS